MTAVIFILWTMVAFALGVIACHSAMTGDKILAKHEEEREQENELQDWGTTLKPNADGELIQRMQDGGQIRKT